MKRTRRSVLKAGAGSVAVGAVAGCLTEVDFGANDGGYAAFFALYDWAQTVSGGALEFAVPVDVGEIGHGWSPDGDLASDVATSAIFVYLDSPEFSWAQELAATLERDYADEVVLVDGLEGIDLLPWDHEHDHEADVDYEHGDDHGDADNGDDDHDHEDHESDENDHDHGSDENDHDHEDHEDDDHEDHEDDDPEHGAFDPHAWVDPVRAIRIVDTIVDGLAAVDPDGADAFESNASAYEERLNALDRRLRELVENAERRVGVVAGHDSFRYLEDRYGFSLHSPTGVSPERAPSPGEIADTIELVNDEGIDVVLYDRFESPRLAETIVENSEATSTAPVTAAEGTTVEWSEKGWGYVEQMEEINLPAFEKALGVP